MANRAPPRTSKTRKIIIFWLSVATVVLFVLTLSTWIIAFFGLLPTWVAFIVDRTREKYATFTVAGLNVCGVFPYLVDLWKGDHSISQASNIITDPFSLVVMMGAAAFGWMMFITVPPVITSFLAVLAQKKVSLLRTQQRKLIEEWGESVARPRESAAPANDAA